MGIEGGARSIEVQEQEIDRSANERVERNQAETQRSGEKLEANSTIDNEIETTEGVVPEEKEDSFGNLEKSLEDKSEIADDAYEQYNDMQEIGQDVKESVKSFEQTKWDDMSIDERQEAVSNLAGSVAEDLDLENKPDIKYYQSDEPGDYGGFSAAENAIYINENQMDDAVETADTIAHESRHCWQHEYAEKSDTPQAQEFRENFEDYIRPEDDYRGYRNQPVEVDAREYAENVISNIPENRD